MMQNTNNNETHHIKVSLNNEIRRFAFSSSNFTELSSMVKRLFSLPSDSVLQIRFLDDEEDWINLSQDNELDYAFTLSPSVLRLSVNVVSEDLPETSADQVTEDETVWHKGPRRGRRGRGCGNSGRGKGGRVSQQNLATKSQRLSHRIEVLQKKLDTESIPKDRARVMLWRLQKLQDKLEVVKANEQLVSSDTPLPFPGGRGFGRGCGRGRGKRGGRGRGRAKCGPCPPSDFKANLKTGCQSGTEDDGTTAPTPFREAKKNAKASRCPAKVETFKAKKQHMIQCRQELCAARKSGDRANVEILRNQLQQARADMKQAKLESFEQ